MRRFDEQPRAFDGWLPIRQQNDSAGVDFTPVHPFHPPLYRHFDFQRHWTAIVEVQVGGQHTMPPPPGRRTHRFVDEGRQGTAVCVPRWTLFAVVEADFSGDDAGFVGEKHGLEPARLGAEDKG